jgi:hypothetical protein
MATPDITAGTVMDGARALLNDAADSQYTNTYLLPYLKTAFRELREYLSESNIPVTNKTDTVLSIPANTSIISFVTVPPLPQDLVEIQAVWSRINNTDPWFPLTPKDFIPPQLEGIDYSDFIYYAWGDNKLHLLPCNQIMDLKLQYIQQLTEPADENSTLGIINGQTFLEYRVASLAARYMMVDPERAEDLDANAQASLDRTVNIENKSRQSIYTRRRPFRANWKTRTPF